MVQNFEPQHLHSRKKKQKQKQKQNKTKKKQKTKQNKKKHILNTFYYVHRFSKKMRPSHNIYINRLGLGFFVLFCLFVS